MIRVTLGLRPSALGLAVLLITATLTGAVGAQRDEARFDAAFDAVMKAQAPEFRPQPRRPVLRPREGGYRQWTTSDAAVSVHYFVSESPESASKLLRERLLRIMVGFRKVSGYGDESYLVAQGVRDPGLWFRQGAVIVEVSAPNVGALQRFAKLFGDVVANLPL